MIAYLEKGDAAAAPPLLERSVNQLARFRFLQIQGLFTAALAEARLDGRSRGGAQAREDVAAGATTWLSEAAQALALMTVSRFDERIAALRAVLPSA